MSDAHYSCRWRALGPSAARGTAAKPYWNPYVVGFLLGLVLLATYVITGRGLGATGAFSSIAAWLSASFLPTT